MGKKKSRSAKQGGAAPREGVDGGRRTLLYLGLGTAATAGLAAVGYTAGWFESSCSDCATPIEAVRATGRQGPVKYRSPIVTTVEASSVRRAVDEAVSYYARELQNPSALIHAVRAFGRDFTLADGTKAVDHLCARYAVEREVNGKRYVHFDRAAEVHDNSFLKTFLEAGVSLDQPVVVGGNRYTLRDVADGARALMRFDPHNPLRYEPLLFQEHLPWGIIALSILVPPDQPTWTNAWGEKIDFNQVIDRGLADYERISALGEPALLSGQAEPSSFREEVRNYSCFALHSLYSFLSALEHGYRAHNLPARVRRMMDVLTYRLKSDAEASRGEYQAAGTGAPPLVVEALTLRALIKLYGHAFESINYAKLHQLATFNAGQERRIEAGEAAFHASLARMLALDWKVLSQNVDGIMGPGGGEKTISDIIIALGHASRAMKLLTPDNPDRRAEGPAQGS
jgi:hypothetical protein